MHKLNSKNKMIIAVVLIFVLLLGLCIRYHIEAKNTRTAVMYSIYYNLLRTRRALDFTIPDIEEDPSVNTTNTQDLIILSNEFTNVHTLLIVYLDSLPPDALYYSDVLGFQQIARTLGTFEDGSYSYDVISSSQNLIYNGMLSGDTISDNEILYLKELRKDIAKIVDDMEDPNAAPNIYNAKYNYKLKTDEFNEILNSFFNKWVNNDGTSPHPYTLLEE